MFSFLVVNKMQFKRSWLVIYPTLLLFVLIVKLLVFGFFKQYRGWWRYVGISDLTGIMRASLVSTFIIVALWFAMGHIDSVRAKLPVGLESPAEGICIADMFATILLLAGLRMSIRLYFEEFRTVEAGRLKRLLIVGASNAGEALLREIHRMSIVQYEVIGFIDDDPVKQGARSSVL
jgi:FlaA1/EpsC-like NDP-sugar epimerase